MINSLDDKSRRDINSQIEYAARKYGGNLPESVARAHATSLANEAMKNYDVSKGNIKTYLSKRLQKLSRIAYKASTPLIIPESRLMNRAKIRDYVDEHVDTHGFRPDSKNIAKNTGVSMSDAKNYMQESSSVSNESSFDNIGSGTAMAPSLTALSIVNSMPFEIKDMAKDIYINGMKESDVLKKYRIGRTSFFSKKKKIDNFIREHSSKMNVSYT